MGRKVCCPVLFKAVPQYWASTPLEEAEGRPLLSHRKGPKLLWGRLQVSHGPAPVLQSIRMAAEAVLSHGRGKVCLLQGCPRG